MLFVFIGVLLDPIAIVMAVIAGLVARSWLWVAAGSIVVGGVVEFLVAGMNGQDFDLPRMLLRVLVVALWASAAFALKSRKRRKVASAETGSD